MCVYASTSQPKKKSIFVDSKIIVMERLSQGYTRALVVDVRIVIPAPRAHGQLIILRRRKQPFSHRDKEDSSNSDHWR